MINNIFPFTVQSAIQPVTENCIVIPFEASALWIDDLITLWLVYGY